MKVRKNWALRLTFPHSNGFCGVRLDHAQHEVVGYKSDVQQVRGGRP